ncbi:unnamed protein product [Leuciscus chuanchicus]
MAAVKFQFGRENIVSYIKYPGSTAPVWCHTVYTDFLGEHKTRTFARSGTLYVNSDICQATCLCNFMLRKFFTATCKRWYGQCHSWRQNICDGESTGLLPSGRAPPKRRCVEPLTVNTLQVNRFAAEPADVEVDVDNLENIPLQKCDVGVQWPEISEHNYCSSKSTKDSATQTDPAPSISAYDFDDKDILADRGFTITDVLPPGVTLAIPAFTRGCKELPEHEVTQTRRLANLIREETEGEASEMDENEHIDEQEEGDEYSWDMAEDIEGNHLF